MTQHSLSCRACGTATSHIFADLGVQPLCESYVSAAQLHAPELFYPLVAYVCPQCFLVQAEASQSPEQIFSEYAYFSSYSKSWLEHARSYVEMISGRLALSERSFVVEVASNDGYLLQNFVRRGVPALGIDPAANIAPVAEQKGVRTLVAFFGSEVARQLAAQGNSADLLVANNVLAHTPHLNDFVSGVKLLLKPGGVATLEFPHLLRLIEENQFDTIYHEHFSYFSLYSAQRLFARHGLELFDVETLSTHGGSLRVYARHRAGAAPKSAGLEHLRAEERRARLDTLEPYLSFGERVAATKRKLLALLIGLKDQGKTIVGYGAPGKGNTLLNYCGVRTDLVDYTVDRNPYKQGRFLPGTRIPIRHPDEIGATKPDFVLILPWNLKDEITAQLAFVRDWGGRFIVPIPEAAILP